MLQIDIPGGEFWDEQKQEFVHTQGQTLQLEHSLVSISKWESKWNKAFLSKRDKTPEEILDYIQCMTITTDVKPETYACLSKSNVDQIRDYIAAPMTATVLPPDRKGNGGAQDTVTSELIYWWMIALDIPFECQEWHLNRLLTLIRVCNAKNTPPKKTGRRELASRYAAQNAANRRRYGSRG